jgi:hypothetical protein
MESASSTVAGPRAEPSRAAAFRVASTNLAIPPNRILPPMKAATATSFAAL